MRHSLHEITRETSVRREQQLRGDVDCIPDGPGDRTEVGVDVVCAFGRLPVVVFDAADPVGDVDPLDDQNPAVLLDLTDRRRCEVTGACVDAARLQRAPEGSRQSTAGRSDQVVEGRGVGWVIVGGDAVVLGHLRVDTERDRLVEGRDPCPAQRTLDPFDLDHRPVHHVAHPSSLLGE
jgi:hypothetical protein